MLFRRVESVRELTNDKQKTMRLNINHNLRG